jgi:hypothetical protein
MAEHELRVALQVKSQPGRASLSLLGIQIFSPGIELVSLTSDWGMPKRKQRRKHHDTNR